MPTQPTQPQGTASPDLSFSSPLNHAIHIRRLHRQLIDEMKCFEAAWGNDADSNYQNHYLEDMHKALIYLKQMMDFEGPSNAPPQTRSPSKILDEKWRQTSNVSSQMASQPLYEPTLPVTKPYSASSSKKGKKPSIDSSPKTKQDGVTGNISHTHSAIQTDVSTSIAQGRSKGKGRATQSENALTENVDVVVPAARLNNSTDIKQPKLVKKDPEEDERLLVHQEFKRNYTVVGPITSDTPRYQPTPMHPPIYPPRYHLRRVDPYPSYDERQMSRPKENRNGRRESIHRHDSEPRRRGSLGSEDLRSRGEESSRHRSTHGYDRLLQNREQERKHYDLSSSHKDDPSRHYPRSPFAEKCTGPRNGAERGKDTYDGQRHSTMKRPRRDEEEEEREKSIRSQKRHRRE